MDQSPGGSIYLLTPRFNDLIMVAMLSNLSHMFEVGGQRVFWMQKKDRQKKREVIRFLGSAYVTAVK